MGTMETRRIFVCAMSRLKVIYVRSNVKSRSHANLNLAYDLFSNSKIWEKDELYLLRWFVDAPCIQFNAFSITKHFPNSWRPSFIIIQTQSILGEDRHVLQKECMVLLIYLGNCNA